MVTQATVEVSDRHIYDISPARPVTKHGPLDKRMGVSSNHDACETCHRKLKDCNGHFGYVKLALPVFHVGYLKKTIEILQCICKVWRLSGFASELILTGIELLSSFD